MVREGRAEHPAETLTNLAVTAVFGTVVWRVLANRGVSLHHSIVWASSLSSTQVSVLFVLCCTPWITSRWVAGIFRESFGSGHGHFNSAAVPAALGFELLWLTVGIVAAVGGAGVAGGWGGVLVLAATTAAGCRRATDDW